MGDAPTRTLAPRVVTSGGPAPGNGGSPSDPNTPPPNIIQKAIRALTAPPPRGPSNNRSGPAASAIRKFFSADLFRQMIEFSFVPPNPVRVGEEWKARGDTPITGRGRFTYDATGKFDGWQQHGQTNCARISIRGNVHSQSGSPPASGATKETLKGTLWVEPHLSFPITSTFDSQISLTNQTTVRRIGTNSVPIKVPPKLVRQNVTLTLVDVTPLQELAAEAKAE